MPLAYVLLFTFLHLRAALQFSRLLLPVPLLAPAPLPPVPVSVSTVVAQHDVHPERPTILWPLCWPTMPPVLRSWALSPFSGISHHFISRSWSLVPHSFPHAPLGPLPNHLTSHLIDHMTNPQSTITCHHSAVRSIMTCPHLTLFDLPAHDAPLRSRQLMMELYLELPRHGGPY